MRHVIRRLFRWSRFATILIPLVTMGALSARPAAAAPAGVPADVWHSLSTVGAPSPRSGHTAVWARDEMIVWGGEDASTAFNDGYAYNPRTDTWRPIATPSFLAPRALHTAVWTGDRLLVWGGKAGAGNGTTLFGDGGRYDPVNDTWEAITTLGAPQRRSLHGAVWAPEIRRMLIWGGYDGSSCDPFPGCTRLADGRLYDPDTNTWQPISSIGEPSARAEASTVWTGLSLVVWSGYSELTDRVITGGRYLPPSLDTWTATSIVGAPQARTGQVAVWTGSEMVVWGGHGSAGERLETGGRYDPGPDSWTSTSTMGAPPAADAPTAVWTGSRMIVWGGHGGPALGYLNSGGLYDPSADSWSPTSTLGAPTPRVGHSAVWTGGAMIVWGGSDGAGYLADGGVYGVTCDPGDASSCDDGDACTDDRCDENAGCTHTDRSASCDDGNTCTADSCERVSGCVHAPAPNSSVEVCNGVDDNCNGATDEGLGNTTCGVGACRVTVDNCTAGVPQVCTPSSPSPESCNGIDDDCDGTVDDVYVFGGYLQPVNADGSSIFNRKQTIPFKFKLRSCGGSTVTSAVANIGVHFWSSGVMGTEVESVSSSGGANSGTQYRYDPTADQYIYNLSAKTLQANSTYLVRTTLDDGSSHDVLISIRAQ
ncbi:MAG: PxKF domain-containing protein [Acidobacteria bacterium]|nr:PxKF domain-containing protein [Acidobacteriota bacterium]